MILEVESINISRTGDTPMARVAVVASQPDENEFHTSMEIIVPLFDLSLNADEMAAVAIDKALVFLSAINLHR